MKLESWDVLRDPAGAGFFFRAAYYEGSQLMYGGCPLKVPVSNTEEAVLLAEYLRFTTEMPAIKFVAWA